MSQNPDVWRSGEAEFFVKHLAEDTRPDWHHNIIVECEYCHREIKVVLVAPLNTPKYVEEEAKRLALLEHLRTEHQSKPKRKTGESGGNPN
jgi:hypothetical protein